MGNDVDSEVSTLRLMMEESSNDPVFILAALAIAPLEYASIGPSLESDPVVIEALVRRDPTQFQSCSEAMRNDPQVIASAANAIQADVEKAVPLFPELYSEDETWRGKTKLQRAWNQAVFMHVTEKKRVCAHNAWIISAIGGKTSLDGEPLLLFKDLPKDLCRQFIDNHRDVIFVALDGRISNYNSLSLSQMQDPNLLAEWAQCTERGLSYVRDLFTSIQKLISELKEDQKLPWKLVAEFLEVAGE